MEKIVRAWTDKVLHLGNRTTNRVESEHGVLKKLLTNGVGDLATCWQAGLNMILLQHVEIQASFGRSVTVLEHWYKEDFLFHRLEGKVSRAALSFIFEEANRSTKIDSKDCGCVLRTSYGLPCACILALKIREHKSIQEDDIHRTTLVEAFF